MTLRTTIRPTIRPTLRTRRSTTVSSALVGLLLLGAAACGGTAAGSTTPDPTDPADPPTHGMCAPDVTDCVDAVAGDPDLDACDADGCDGGHDAGDDGVLVPPDDGWDEFPSDTAREEARNLLGMHEGDLAPDVRIGRRGADTMMLTEDYVLGRVTVELDDDGSGYRVTSLTIELPTGPETIELEAS